MAGLNMSFMIQGVPLYSILGILNFKFEGRLNPGTMIHPPPHYPVLLALIGLILHVKRDGQKINMTKSQYQQHVHKPSVKNLASESAREASLSNICRPTK
jgi:hypothetical protein